MRTTPSPREVLRRCAISELTTKEWSLEQDVAGYASAGLSGIGVWLPKLEVPAFAGGYLPSAQLDADVIAAAAAVITAAGLKVTHVVGSGLWTLPEPDRSLRIEHTLFAMSAAAALGAETLIVVPGPRLGRSLAECSDLAAAALIDIMNRTHAPIRLAIEPLRPGQVDCFNTIGEALDLIDRVGSPDIGVLVDSWHQWRNPSLLEEIERAGDRIFGVHLSDAAPGDDGLGDNVRLIPGDGVIDFAPMLAAIKATGYSGWYEVELEQPPTIEGGYEHLTATSVDRLIELLNA